MNAYRTLVKYSDVEIEIVSLKGHVASFETTNVKVIVVAGGSPEAPSAWVQVLQICDGKTTVSCEGRFDTSKLLIDNIYVCVAEYSPNETEKACLSRSEFGSTTSRCCTSGNVRCCGGCCRDAKTGYGCCP